MHTNAKAHKQQYRHSSLGLVDQSRSFSFTFDGRCLAGYAGDTLASALLANGVQLVGRSFKYHRPRGILSAGAEEPNALVELRTGSRKEPNTRATVTELYQGLVAVSQNRWPSLKYDVLSANAILSPLIAAGFYYKTFMWPPSFWEKLYEPMIRRAAGLGRAADASDPDFYEKAFAFCDVLVVGSGASGLMAALAAGRTGARVILCEEDFRFGGRCLAEREQMSGKMSSQWAAEIERELCSLPEVRIMPRTAIFGVYDGQTYGALERVNDHVVMPPPHEPRQRLWHIVAKRCILAAGAFERAVVFGNNDRPGVMLAGALRTYVNRYGVAPGRRAVIFSNNDDASRTASDLARAGVHIEAIVDSRAIVSKAVRDAAAETRARLICGAQVRRVIGRARVRGAEVVDSTGGVLRLSCDLLAQSGGWDPAVHLTSHLGERPKWNEQLSTFVPDGLPRGMVAVGAAAGLFDLASCVRSGADAGTAAAVSCGFKAAHVSIPVVQAEDTSIQSMWWVRGAPGKCFIDFQNDVTAADIELAAREGFRSVEQVKRYTTLGMATDQGKTANVTGLAILADVMGRPIHEIGTTTFRPPFTPVSISAFAGHHRSAEFRPVRYTPTHFWAKKRSAVFVEAGPWMRAQYYPRSEEKDWRETVNREVNMVRSSVGVCDVSTLGKIDIQGTDAGTFLDRLYCNTFSTLPVGKARFGLMLREDGFVLDDGTTSRLDDRHYFMTTTTANAARVMAHLEFCHQILWPELDVQMVSVTEQWAQLAVAGPRSRETLLRIVDAHHDISNDAFPYLAASNLTICGGIDARLFRLSFSGELAYELSIPSRFAGAAMCALMEVGSEFGIAPYGTEALGTLRIEKGHAAGSEINGQTTAHDLGFGKLLSTKKEFVGRFMATRPALTSSERPSLVGFRPVNRADCLNAGAHFIRQNAERIAQNDDGHMTSTAFSPTLNHWIGLGLLARGLNRVGEILWACDPVRGNEALVEVQPPCFVDPNGERLRA